MIVRETYLICDGGCGTNFGVDNRNKSAIDQRMSSRANGWVVIRGKDYCPECKPLSSMSPREKRIL